MSPLSKTPPHISAAAFAIQAKSLQPWKALI
jgi:hypothetical protein